MIPNNNNTNLYLYSFTPTLRDKDSSKRSPAIIQALRKCTDTSVRKEQSGPSHCLSNVQTEDKRRLPEQYFSFRIPQTFMLSDVTTALLTAPTRGICVTFTALIMILPDALLQSIAVVETSCRI